MVNHHQSRSSSPPERMILLLRFHRPDPNLLSPAFLSYAKIAKEVKLSPSKVRDVCLRASGHIKAPKR